MIPREATGLAFAFAMLGLLVGILISWSAWRDNLPLVKNMTDREKRKLANATVTTIGGVVVVTILLGAVALAVWFWGGPR